MRRLYLLGAIAGALLSGLTFSQAQTQDKFDAEVADVALLTADPVKQELQITASQRDRMNAAAKGYNTLGQSVEKLLKEGKQPTEAQSKALRSEFEKMRTGVLKVLTPTQLRRLRELTLQHHGPELLADKTIGTRVGLTVAQRKTVAQVFLDARKRAADLEKRELDKAMATLPKTKPKTEEEARKRADLARRKGEEAAARLGPQFEKIQAEAESKALAKLSSAQKEKWRALLGKPFHA